MEHILGTSEAEAALDNEDDLWVRLEESAALDLHSEIVVDDGQRAWVDNEEGKCEEVPCCCLAVAYTCTDCKIVVAFEVEVVGEILFEGVVHHLVDLLELVIFFFNFFVICLCWIHPLFLFTWS